MFAGEAIAYLGDEGDAEFQDNVLIELTEWGEDPFVEIAATFGERRVYLKFRMADLKREIKEQSAS